MSVVVDGKTYDDISQAPDLGSLVCIDASRSPQRDYQGFVQDKLKLPKYDDLGTGSSAMLIDPNGVESTIIAKYQATTKQWIDLRGVDAIVKIYATGLHVAKITSGKRYICSFSYPVA